MTPSVTTRGDGDDELLLVLGWGDRPTHEPETWLFDRLTERGWQVHAVTLPENATRFGQAYIDPVARLRERIQPAVTVGQSLGGLVVAHLPGDDPRVYTSPFWGFAGFPDTLVSAVGRLPVERRVIPVGSDPEAIGTHKPATEQGAGDRGASPAWIGAIRGAQRRLPRFRPGSVVHCSLEDTVVSLAAIGRHAPTDRIRLYDGTHEWYAGRGREATLDRVVDDCRRIADGERPTP